MYYDMFNHRISIASQHLEVKKTLIMSQINREVDFMNFFIKLREQNSLSCNLTPPVHDSFEMLSPEMDKEIVNDLHALSKVTPVGHEKHDHFSVLGMATSLDIYVSP